MAGSKKGRKLRPYRTGRVTPVHVLLRTEAERIADEWEHAPTTRDMLDWPVDDTSACTRADCPYTDKGWCPRCEQVSAGVSGDGRGETP